MKRSDCRNMIFTFICSYTFIFFIVLGSGILKDTKTEDKHDTQEPDPSGGGGVTAQYRYIYRIREKEREKYMNRINEQNRNCIEDINTAIKEEFILVNGITYIYFVRCMKNNEFIEHTINDMKREWNIEIVKRNVTMILKEEFYSSGRNHTYHRSSCDLHNVNHFIDCNDCLTKLIVYPLNEFEPLSIMSESDTIRIRHHDDINYIIHRIFKFFEILIRMLYKYVIKGRNDYDLICPSQIELVKFDTRN